VRFLTPEIPVLPAQSAELKSADSLQIHEVPLIVAHPRNGGKAATNAAAPPRMRHGREECGRAN
jgi:hypothetical protein